MERNYSTGVDDSAVFFTGLEVEKTPAYGLHTLFVVGVQSIEDIEEKLQDHTIKHIFFGANHSFNPILQNYDSWREWEQMIQPFLKKGYMCSLDIPLSHVDEFNDSDFNSYDNFIPQIRVPITYVRLWNYNTMIKIDDRGFNQTNPGVWCHSLHDLMDREKFTKWSDYGNDKIV